MAIKTKQLSFATVFPEMNFEAFFATFFGCDFRENAVSDLCETFRIIRPTTHLGDYGSLFLFFLCFR